MVIASHFDKVLTRWSQLLDIFLSDNAPMASVATGHSKCDNYGRRVDKLSLYMSTGGP